LAALYFGRVCHSEEAVNKGIKVYVAALKRLQDDLSRQETALRWETLASVLCLGMYENVTNPGFPAWLNHYEGISRLVYLRGPSLLREPRDKELFRQCRFAIVSFNCLPISPRQTLKMKAQILAALLYRRHCYLASSEWRLALYPETLTDELHSTFAEVPGILHDFDLLATTLDGAYDQGLLQRVKSTLATLHLLGERCTQKASVASDTAELQSTSSDCTFYWALLTLQKAILLCLVTVCDALTVDLFPGGGTIPLGCTQGRQSTGSKTERQLLAIDICELSNRCLEHGVSSQTAFLLLFPLQMASRNLVSGSSEAGRLESMMKNVLADAHGFRV
jgi:hypothetical protein